MSGFLKAATPSTMTPVGLPAMVARKPARILHGTPSTAAGSAIAPSRRPCGPPGFPGQRAALWEGRRTLALLMPKVRWHQTLAARVEQHT